MNEIRTLGNPIKDNTDNNGFVEHRHRKRFRIRFLVRRDDSYQSIQTVPKYMTLHVSRLKPDTGPGDLQTFFAASFPEAVCHQ